MKAEVAEAQSRAQSLEAEAAAAKKACEEAVAAADAASRGEAEQITQSVAFIVSLHSLIVGFIHSFMHTLLIIIIESDRLIFFF